MEPMKPMKPMKPMQPMRPMKPMEQLKPLTPGARWWPEGLTSPSSAGEQDGIRYAFFPSARRLAIERNGHVEQYDTGDHAIYGVAQSGANGAPVFTSQHGEIDLSSLKKVA